MSAGQRPRGVSGAGVPPAASSAPRRASSCSLCTPPLPPPLTPPPPPPAPPGFIGSHTVLALLDAGHSAVIVDDLSNSFPQVFPRMQKLAGDNASKMTFVQVRHAIPAQYVKPRYSSGRRSLLVTQATALLGICGYHGGRRREQLSGAKRLLLL